jgi:hypothetical protein
MNIPKASDFYYDHHNDDSDDMLNLYRDAVLNAIIEKLNELDYEPAKWQIIEMLEDQRIN